MKKTIREKTIDAVYAGWGDGRNPLRLHPGSHSYLFAVNGKNEGFFLVSSRSRRRAILDRPTFRAIADEAKAAGLEPTWHVYATTCSYSGPGLNFYHSPVVT